MPRIKKDLGQIPSENTQLQTAAIPSVLCGHLANTNKQGNSAFYQIILFFVKISLCSL